MDITRIRAVFTDRDGKRTRSEFHLEPSFTLSRDDDHEHSYWLVDDLPVAEFRPLQKRLIEHYQTDKAICNPARLMRLGGTLNCKPGKPPVLYTLVDPGWRVVYATKDILAGLSSPPVAPANPNPCAGVDKKLHPETVELMFAHWNPTLAGDRGTWYGAIRLLAEHRIGLTCDVPEEWWLRLAIDWSSGVLRCRHVDKDFQTPGTFKIGADGSDNLDTEEEIEAIFNEPFSEKDDTQKITTGSLVHHANAGGYTGSINDRQAAERGDGAINTFGTAIHTAVATANRSGHIIPIAAAPGSQIDIADNFARAHADDLRYVMAEKKWFRFDGVSWREDETGHVLDLIRKGLGQLSLETKGADALARAIGSDRTLRGVESLARVDRRLAASSKQWDSDPWVLCTPAGIIDLLTGELRPAQPADYCRKITTVAPAAPGTVAPNWQRILQHLSGGDAEHQRYFQKVAGYCLVGTLVDQAFFIPVGETNSGKTTTFETWRSIMGDYATTAAPETFLETRNGSRATNDIAEIIDARMVIAAEPDESERLSASRIKRMCGGDHQRVRHLYQSGREHKAGFKVILHCNEVPHMGPPDPAVQRRLHIVPAGRTIPVDQRDPQLAEKLKHEYPAILRWMIDGCIAWQKEGLKRPAAVEQRTHQYFDSEDPLAEWLNERVDKVAAAWSPTDALYKDYLKTAQDNGTVAISCDLFSKRLKAIQWDAHDGNGKSFVGRFTSKKRGKRNVRGFLGIQLKPSDAEAGRLNSTNNNILSAMAAEF